MHTASQDVCPCCPRHCPLSAPSCERGRAYAARPSENRQADHAAQNHGGPEAHDRYPHEPHAHEHGKDLHGPHGHYGPHDGRGHFGCEHDQARETAGLCDPASKPHGPEFLDDPESLNGLMHRCSHALHQRSHHDRAQRSVLALLAAWGETDQRTLQQTLSIQPGSVSELLAKLEAKGYITKARSEQDRRMATITLTEQGRQAAKALPDKKPDLYSALTQEEQDTFKVLLKKLLDSWQ